MGKLGKSKLNLEEISKLHFLGKTDVDIASTMGYSVSSVTYARKNILKLGTVYEDISLSNELQEILIGTLLGDSYIGYTHSKCRFPSITFSHCEKLETYARTKFNKLGPIMSSITKRLYKTKTIIMGKKCNVLPVLYAIGRNCKCLVKYRQLFYNENGKKVIPIEYLWNHFTARSLSYLYMDDGCINLKSYNLNLQCFTTEELEDFIYLLKKKFNLEFILKKDKTLYLRYNSIDRFEDLIKPYITEDMQYKIH